MKKKYYYLYQITNQVNGKIYVGIHQTDNLNDGYMGSGKLLQRAQKKYDIKSFKKEILNQFDNEENMYKEEALVVDAKFVMREDTYNITEGGIGGGLQASIIAGKHTYKLGLGIFSEKSKEKLHEYIISEENRQNLSRMSKLATLSNAQKKKKETFKKIKHQQGKKNSQYGKMWITNDIESKKIMSGEEIPNEWRKGRVIKK